jgi:hypothetical protein
MKTKLSRRAVSAALLGVPALAQAPPPAGGQKPQEAVKPAADGDVRTAASRQVQSTAALLRKFEIAIETEPAFRFKP